MTLNNLFLLKLTQHSLCPTPQRYVGRSYESLGDLGKFDAKGIETVRRDGCGLYRRTLKVLLEELFASSDLSKVKAKYQQVMADIWHEKLSVQDLVFAKEVKFGKYRSEKSEPPGATVVRNKKRDDLLFQPPFKMRVPYLVVCRPPKSTLRASVVFPEALLLRGSGLRSDNNYYEKGLHAALMRLLGLAGCDIKAWREEMGAMCAPSRRVTYDAPLTRGGQMLMSSFVTSNNCIICAKSYSRVGGPPVCNECQSLPVALQYMSHQQQLRQALETDRGARQRCAACSQDLPTESTLFSKDEIVGRHCCRSLDCAVTYARAKGVLDVENLMYGEENCAGGHWPF